MTNGHMEIIRRVQAELVALRDAQYITCMSDNGRYGDDVSFLVKIPSDLTIEELEADYNAEQAERDVTVEFPIFKDWLHKQDRVEVLNHTEYLPGF